MLGDKIIFNCWDTSIYRVGHIIDYKGLYLRVDFVGDTIIIARKLTVMESLGILLAKFLDFIGLGSRD